MAPLDIGAEAGLIASDIGSWRVAHRLGLSSRFCEIERKACQTVKST